MKPHRVADLHGPLQGYPFAHGGPFLQGNDLKHFLASFPFFQQIISRLQLAGWEQKVFTKWLRQCLSTYRKKAWSHVCEKRGMENVSENRKTGRGKEGRTPRNRPSNMDMMKVVHGASHTVPGAAWADVGSCSHCHGKSWNNMGNLWTLLLGILGSNTKFMRWLSAALASWRSSNQPPGVILTVSCV